jgi:hypothetical protein
VIQKDIAKELNQYHPSSAFVKFELESLGRTAFDTTSLLFQTGYLTIKDERKEEDGSQSLRLDYPNYEIKKAFLAESFQILLKTKFDYAHLESLRKALDANNAKLFYDLLDSYFRGVPHTIFKKSSNITDAESFYTGVLAFALQFLPAGYSVQFEDATSDGSIDLVIETPTRFFLIEHKILPRNEDKADRSSLLKRKAHDALRQIDEKKYSAKFSINKQGTKPITKVGVCFDAQTRSVGYVEIL